MLQVLRIRTYLHLFAAQVIALIGTGLATVALGLLAFQIAGDKAGAVLGVTLAIKMIAYVVIAPIAGAFVQYFPRRTMLVSLDLVRAIAASFLPYVTEVWQIYVLIFVLQSASAVFTPAFQATTPDVLPDEHDYTEALSLSRVAYDLESVVSPLLAAALLTVVTFRQLFLGTIVGFLGSALLVVTVTIPNTVPTSSSSASVVERTTRGMRIYLANPRLRGLLAIDLSVAAVASIALVNTVVYVQGLFQLTQRHTAIALACFGGGSMIAAFTLPSILDRVDDRSVMLRGSLLLAIAGYVVAGLQTYAQLLILWTVLGVGYSAAQTPSGRLLRRSSNDEDRPALFAAQFALSHACWLVTYPVAGRVGAALGLSTTALILAGISTLAVLMAWILWPASDPDVLVHSHDDLDPSHPHIRGSRNNKHAHVFVIDDNHRSWPVPAEEPPNEAASSSDERQPLLGP